MKKTLPKILFFVLLILLIGSNIFFISKYAEPTIHVQIGLPSFDKEGNITATMVTPFLDNQKDTNLILLAFMMGWPMKEAQFPTELPHGNLIINYEGCSYPHNMWLTEDSVIFETSTESTISYREFHNDHNNVISILNDLLNSLKNYKIS